MADYQFAPKYSAEELLSDPQRRRSFFEDFLRWESRFLQPGVGLSGPYAGSGAMETKDGACTSNGLTRDGAHIVAAGDSLLPREHSNPSKEALHIALLCIAVAREGLVSNLISKDGALRQLEQKASAFEAYRSAFPQHAGFMPWFSSDAEARPLEPELAVRYNGMLAWTLYVACNVLEEANEPHLGARFRAHLDAMRTSAVPFAYKGGGKVAARLTSPPGSKMLQSAQNCDDPFAGEVFCLFLDLLCDWGGMASEREEMWTDESRRQWLDTAIFEVAESGSGQKGTEIEVMSHGTFSAHEEWKYLLLPYKSTPVCRRLLHGAEKARTAFARAHALPGLLGDCHVPEEASDVWNGRTQHITSFGIPQISGLRAADSRHDTVATSGVMGLLLADPVVGAVWLRETLTANEKMQTQWGALESCAADGSVVCPLLTWDGKATVALAMLGGLGDLVRKFLEKDRLWDRFTHILENVYGHLSESTLRGELDVDMSLPPSLDATLSSEWRCLLPGEPSRVDVEMVELCRGIVLPTADAWKLAEVRGWFDARQRSPPSTMYSTPPLDDWWGFEGRTGYETDALGREQLYQHVVDMFDLGVPLMLLARQAPLYPLYFDLDIYGGCVGDANAAKVHELAWLDGRKLFVREVVSAVLQLYPEFQSGIELIVFCSSGFCQKTERYKASYHFVFPEIIVDRPVKCWLDSPDGPVKSNPARHILVRDHVLHTLMARTAVDEQLASFHDQLLNCCDRALIESSCDEEEEPEENPEDLVYLNDWSEIFDERPLWHEPWPEAATGLRLPFTDKLTEGRPKVPLGRWRFGACEGTSIEAAALEMRKLPDLDAVDWVRVGDISCSPPEGEATLTPWDATAVHPDVDQKWSPCPCPSCREAPPTVDEEVRNMGVVSDGYRVSVATCGDIRLCADLNTTAVF